MIIGGLPFPYDHARSTEGFGSIGSFIIRTHPLAMWVPALLLGVVLGWCSR